MDLKEITYTKALATLEKACSIRTPHNHNKPYPDTNVDVIAIVDGWETKGLAQIDTLLNNYIVFKYEQPQLLFPNRMEYMGAFVGKNLWCYPSEEDCRFEDGECFIHY